MEFDRQSALFSRGIVTRQTLDSAATQRDVTVARRCGQAGAGPRPAAHAWKKRSPPKRRSNKATTAVRVMEAQASYAPIRADPRHHQFRLDAGGRGSEAHPTFA